MTSSNDMRGSAPKRLQIEDVDPGIKRSMKPHFSQSFLTHNQVDYSTSLIPFILPTSLQLGNDSEMATIPSLPARLSPVLTGREAITDAIHRFLTGLDTSDKSLFESSLTETATLNINGTVTEGLTSIITDRYGFISKLDTTHSLTNVRIHVEEGGNRASATANALSQHYRPGEGMQGGKDALLLGSLFWVELVRDEGEQGTEGEFWRIQHFLLKSTWAEGEWGVMKA
ncbi:hypothetical protein BJX63DRAFT_397866 [Aspergillus granulosus]|uniref:SnoaL-like domain-containing protein n=1 Tax=Aspergillus granulosus TaxID=176169 RepID=A0ABR4H965_9EURO